MKPQHRFCRYIEEHPTDFHEAYFRFTVDHLRERGPAAVKEYTEELGDVTAEELERLLQMVADEAFDDAELGDKVYALAEGISDKMRDDLREWSDDLVDFMWLGFGPTSSDYSLRAFESEDGSLLMCAPADGEAGTEWALLGIAHDSETASAIFREFVRDYTPNLPSELTNCAEALIPRQAVWEVYYELTEERGEWLSLLDEVTSRAAEPNHLARSLNLLREMGSRFADWDASEEKRAEETAKLTPEAKKAILDAAFDDCYGN